MKFIIFLSGILFSASLFSQKVVQINIQPLLNARIITTLSDGKLVTWPDALNNGGSGEATQAAADKMGNPTAKALPNDGAFKANSKHPYVKLNFSNSEPTGNQVHRSVGVDSFSFKVPKAKYSKVLMFFMSGAGNSNIQVTLNYVIYCCACYLGDHKQSDPTLMYFKKITKQYL